MDIHFHLPLAMRVLRQRARLTQQEVADTVREAGTAKTTASMVSLWESGEQTPSLESLAAFLTAVGFDFGDLQEALDAVKAADEAGKTAKELLRDFRRQGFERVAVDSELAERVRELEMAVYGRSRVPLRERNGV